MIEHIKKYWKKYCVLFAILALVGTFIYQRHVISIKSQENAQYEQNWKAVNDTLRTYKLKNGELLAAKNGYILSNAELCEQLNIAKTELDDIKSKLKSDPVIVTNVQAQIVRDTIIMKAARDTVGNIYFSLDDQWLHLSGSVDPDTIPPTAILHNLSIPTPIVVGMTKDYQFYVTSSNPYIQITDISAGIVEKYIPKKSHWSIGVNAGFGAYYNINSKTFGYGPGINIGLQYNF